MSGCWPLPWRRGRETSSRCLRFHILVAWHYWSIKFWINELRTACPFLPHSNWAALFIILFQYIRFFIHYWNLLWKGLPICRRSDRLNAETSLGTRRCNPVLHTTRSMTSYLCMHACMGTAWPSNINMGNKLNCILQRLYFYIFPLILFILRFHGSIFLPSMCFRAMSPRCPSGLFLSSGSEPTAGEKEITEAWCKQTNNKRVRLWGSKKTTTRSTFL